MVQVKEKSLEEIESRLDEMKTDLNRIDYLESALKGEFTFEIKRNLWEKLAELYEERRMFEKAGRAMANKAGIDVTFREKIDSYIKAGELFSRAGKIEDAEDMFIRAGRDASVEQKEQIKLARKNIYVLSAEALEKVGKKGSALKFYEKLIKMRLEDFEREQVKKRLIEIYKALGKFREVELVEGL